MVTYDLTTGEIIEEPDQQVAEVTSQFSEAGIDYVCDDEITFPRSETPDFLYDLVPDLDERSQIKLAVEDSPEQIWLTEIEEGEFTMTFFIPLSWKKAGRRFGFGLEEYQDSLEEIAEGLRSHYRQQSDDKSRIVGHHSMKNLNHLLNRRD
jgi:hypothetical protein